MTLLRQRFQTTDCLDIRNMSLSQNEVIFQIGDPIKTPFVRHHLQEIGFKAFPLNDKLCIVNAIRAYLDLYTIRKQGQISQGCY